VELKAPTGRISKRQEVVFKEFEEQGCPVFILRSIDDVEDFICEALGFTPISTTNNLSGPLHSKFGIVSASGFGEDDDIVDDTGGAV